MIGLLERVDTIERKLDLLCLHLGFTPIRMAEIETNAVQIPVDLSSLQPYDK